MQDKKEINVRLCVTLTTLLIGQVKKEEINARLRVTLTTLLIWTKKLPQMNMLGILFANLLDLSLRFLRNTTKVVEIQFNMARDNGFQEF